MTEAATQRSTRSTLIMVLGTTLYFAVLLLILFVLDKSNFSSDKSEIIRDNFYQIFPLPDDLNDQARRVLFANSDVERRQGEEKLRASLRTIVEGTSSMYRMLLYNEKGEQIIVVEKTDKLSTYNDWSNSLFFRNYSGRSTLNVSRARVDESTPSARPGMVVGHYTTPKDYAPIEGLTARYRAYALGLIAAWFLVYAALYRYMLRPLRNVMRSLDMSRNRRPTLIANPHGPLEEGYNDLVALALLQQIEDELLRISAVPTVEANGGGLERTGIDSVLTIVADAFRFTQMHVLQRPYDEKSVQPWGLLASHPPYKNLTIAEVQEIAAPATTASELVSAHITNENDELLLLARPGAKPIASRVFLEDCVRRLGETLTRTLEAARAYRRDMYRQRSEANIVLSRNIGHDLTNIIATSRLDLMAVRRLLEKPEMAAGAQAKLIQQSVFGLLQSTRFLQEMVNIYRSFSHVKRPAYERRPLAGLIQEFLDGFEPAMSSRIRLERNLAEMMPPPILEPRLMKLALFNVLQNAIDACKKHGSESGRDGGLHWIRITANYEDATETYRIIIEDSGPGIRDAHGRLLTPEEAKRIFNEGYTTRSDTGEGLGLSWVRTIVEEFHDGRVSAGNHEEGGARITLAIRSMERLEARVSQDPPSDPIIPALTGLPTPNKDLHSPAAGEYKQPNE